MCCKGWPARGLNDYTELWASANSNWSYDGDEDFTTYPGYLAAKSTATSTFVDFTPTVANFAPYPRVPTGPFPFRVWQKVRYLCPGGANSGLFEILVTSDSSYLNLLFSYQNGDGHYHIEADSELGTDDFDTGIALSADRQDDFEIIITPVSYAIYLNGVLVTFKSGLDFPSITLTEITVQRHAADNQAMLARTEIFTQAP